MSRPTVFAVLLIATLFIACEMAGDKTETSSRSSIKSMMTAVPSKDLLATSLPTPVQYDLYSIEPLVLQTDKNSYFLKTAGERIVIAGAAVKWMIWEVDTIIYEHTPTKISSSRVEWKFNEPLSTSELSQTESDDYDFKHLNPWLVLSTGGSHPFLYTLKYAHEDTPDAWISDTWHGYTDEMDGIAGKPGKGQVIFDFTQVKAAYDDLKMDGTIKVNYETTDSGRELGFEFIDFLPKGGTEKINDDGSFKYIESFIERSDKSGRMKFWTKGDVKAGIGSVAPYSDVDLAVTVDWVWDSEEGELVRGKGEANIEVTGTSIIEGGYDKLLLRECWDSEFAVVYYEEILIKGDTEIEGNISGISSDCLLGSQSTTVDGDADESETADGDADGDAEGDAEGEVE